MSMNETTATETAIEAQLVPDTDVSTLKTAIEASMPDWESVVDRADRVLVLPDTHYPFHFSTGLVTAPATVRAACELVVDADAEPVVGCTGGPHADAERAGRFLGYERLAEEADVELRHLPDGSGADEFDDGTAVLNLPTVRAEEDGTVSANLARAFGYGSEAAAPGPVRSVLDGTYIYAGTPQRSLFVAGSDDTGALNRWVVDLLSESNDVEPAEPVAESRPVSAAELRSRLTVSTSRDAPDALDDAMGAGYRLYGRLTGDAVPPQFLRGNDTDE